MGGQSRTIEERKIDGRSSVADYSVAGHGSDTSIDKSFSVPSALCSPPTRKRVRSKCVAAMRFTISRARGPRFVKKILLSSPRKTKKKKRSLLEGRERERRETLRADYTVGQCEKYYPLISLRTPCRFHSAKKLTTTGRRFSTTCLRRLSAERATEVNVPQEVAEPRFPLPTRGESKRSTALDTFANLD